MSPDPMLLGLDGPEVRVTARVASRLARPLSELVRRAQRNGEQVDAEVLSTIAAIETASRAYGAHQASVLGQAVTSDPAAGAGSDSTSDEVTSAMVSTMPAKLAAQKLGCTQRNVTDLARRGVLRGIKVADRWLFDPVDVEDLGRARGEA